MKIKDLKIPIYNIKFTIIDSNNYCKVSKFFEKQGLDNLCDIDIHDEGDLFASVHMGLRKGKKHYSNCIYAVFNSKLKGNKINAGLLAHEAVHVADNVYQHIGAKHRPRNPEFRSYLMQFIVNEMVAFFKKNKVKI